MAQHELDVRRLLCPLPVIRVQNRVAGLDAGDTLEVICTDPGAMQDIPAWCRLNGHTIVAKCAHNGTYVIVIEVGAEI